MRERLRRIKYFIGNIYRELTSSLYQLTVTTNQATSIFGCSFGDDGWNHLRSGIEEYERDGLFVLRNSSISNFLNNFCPSSISKLAKVNDEKELELFEYPWGPISKKHNKNKDVLFTRFCGPSGYNFIRNEILDTIKLYEQIKSEGYLPKKYPNSFIQGILLVSKNNEIRFIVLQGNHRMAALAHLGIKNIEVRLLPGVNNIIKEIEVDKWKLVKEGKCSRQHALKIFNYFFNENGLSIKNKIDKMF